MSLDVSYFKQRALSTLGGLLFMCLLCSSGTVSAAAISQSFQTQAPASDMVSGALVSTTATGDLAVELANQDSTNRIAGIVSTSPLVSLSQGENAVKVVISGTTSALVSDINGSIHAGDRITASPIDGVGMLATTDGQTVGVATADLSSTTTTTRTITDHNGTSHVVHIGQIPVQINISYYQAPTSNFLPPFLQNLANGIAGKPVPVARILLAATLILLAFLSIVILVYSSSRAGIISLGRNPLAAGAINKGLAEMGLTALLIVAFGLIATYLILTF